eukprot:12134099-Alexandrium_andersonii.AAC.1
MCIRDSTSALHKAPAAIKTNSRPLPGAVKRNTPMHQPAHAVTLCLPAPPRVAQTTGGRRLRMLNSCCVLVGYKAER